MNLGSQPTLPATPHIATPTMRSGPRRLLHVATVAGCTAAAITGFATQFDATSLYASLTGGFVALVLMPFLFVGALLSVSLALVLILTPIALLVGRGQLTGYGGLLAELARIPLPVVPRYFAGLRGALRSPTILGMSLGTAAAAGWLRSAISVS